ncbi:hypothetical protein ACFLS1_11295 [Verrucomicrobiota bacterium]
MPSGIHNSNDRKDRREYDGLVESNVGNGIKKREIFYRDTFVS